jgi:hypothetical protein
MHPIGRLLIAAAFCCLLTLSARAQENIPGKVYVAEISGSVTFVVDGKMFALKKGDSLPVQGARVETAAGAYVVLVYSNGTSICIDENTIVEIRRFVQNPFPPGLDTTVNEPSISDTIGSITHGRVIITTNQLATGTSMVYLTPQSQVKIRSKEVVIEVEDRETRVALLTGHVTVTPQNAPPGALGQILRDGEMAVVANPPASSIDTPATVQVLPLLQNVIDPLATKIAATERAQKIVVFETVSPPGGTASIVAKPVVPANLPVNLTVSPSTLRTGG